MVARFFTNLFSGSDHRALERCAGGARAIASGPSSQDQQIAPTLPRSVDDPAALKAWLEEEARASVDALMYAFASDGRTNDAQLLVESFQGSIGGTMRQPPAEALHALSLTRDPNTSLRQLIDLVRKDPALAQALLRYANATYYATVGGTCRSLPAAVERVGSGGVHNVILKNIVDVMMCRPGGSHPDLAEKSWSHMIRTAPIARAIAPAFQVADDDAYAIGLLHDAGKVVILDRVDSLRKHLRRDIVIPYSSLSALLRMLHEDFGALAALQWGLGAKVAHAIATHHRAPVPQARNSMSEVLFLAERLDLLALQGKAIDLGALWREGELSGSRSTLELVLASSSGEVALPSVASEPATQETQTQDVDERRATAGRSAP